MYVSRYGDKASLHEEDRAIYLPAINLGYAAKAVSGGKLGGTSVDCRDLDFLSRDCPLFHYPFALYSAGQHNTSTPHRPDMVSQRSRDKTIILGDSGGYQVSTTPGYFSPKLVRDNMLWMEQVSDYSMVLDFPTGGIERGTVGEHIERLTAEGYDLEALNAEKKLGLEYHACLLQTKLNNDQFMADKTAGATKFLNVLQGRSERESRFWYEHVRHYDMEGWAFAGHHQDRFSLMLSRLLDMWDDGLLERVEWIHNLGKSTLSLGVLLTRLQRAVRRHVNPAIQFSFDTSSPFILAAKKQVLTGSTVDARGWSTSNLLISRVPASEDDRLLRDVLDEHLSTRGEPRDRRVADTAISRRVRLGDLRDASGKMSTPGYFLSVAHNVEGALEAHQRAHRAAYDPRVVRDPRVVPLAENKLGAMIDIIFQERDKARERIKEWATSLDALRASV